MASLAAASEPEAPWCDWPGAAAPRQRQCPPADHLITRRRHQQQQSRIRQRPQTVQASHNHDRRSMPPPSPPPPPQSRRSSASSSSSRILAAASLALLLQTGAAASASAFVSSSHLKRPPPYTTSSSSSSSTTTPRLAPFSTTTITNVKASTFGLESLLRLPPKNDNNDNNDKDENPSSAAATTLQSSSSSSSSSSPSSQDKEKTAAAAAAAAAAEADRMERAMHRVSMIHGWCVSPADSLFLDEVRAELAPLLSYLPSEHDRLKVDLALQVAYHAHLGQRRRSGEPFVCHPIAVASILGELGMDADSVAAGLLHDTAEDTSLGLSDIESIFGAVVRRLVEGETKVSKLPKRWGGGRESVATATTTTAAAAAAATVGGEGDVSMSTPTPPPPPRAMIEPQVENLLHLLMAMSQDWRVLVIKICDRCHNMRTISAMTPPKQERIARETLDVYVPLAHKLGLWKLKTELEDMSFAVLHPVEHATLTRAIESKKELLSSLFSNRFGAVRMNMSAILTERLPHLLQARGGLKGHEISIRVEGKQPYQLFRRDPTLGGVEDATTDLLTLKVVVSSEKESQKSKGGGGRRRGQQRERDLQADRALCMEVLEEVKVELRSPSSHRGLRDYISLPRDNGYMCLHDQVRVPGFPSPLAIHVATDWMEDVAQYGLVALWQGNTNTNEDTHTHTLNPTSTSTSLTEDTHTHTHTPVPLELGWLQSLSARTKRVVREEPSVTAQKLIRSLQEQLEVKRLVLTPTGEVLSLDVPKGEAGVTVREAALAQLEEQTRALVGGGASKSVINGGKNEEMNTHTHTHTHTSTARLLGLTRASVNGQRVSLSQRLQHGDVVDITTRGIREGVASRRRVEEEEAMRERRRRGEDPPLWIWQAPLFVYPWCLIGTGEGEVKTSNSASSSSSSSSASLLSNKMWGVSTYTTTTASTNMAMTRTGNRSFGQVNVKKPESVWDSGELVWLREAELRHGRLSLAILAYGLLNVAVAVLGGGDLGGVGGEEMLSSMMDMDLPFDVMGDAAAALVAAGGEGIEGIGGEEAAEMLAAAVTVSGSVDFFDNAAAAVTAAGGAAPIRATNMWFTTAFPALSSMESFQALCLIGAGEVLGGIVPETVSFNQRWQDFRRQRRNNNGTLGLGGGLSGSSNSNNMNMENGADGDAAAAAQLAVPSPPEERGSRNGGGGGGARMRLAASSNGDPALLTLAAPVSWQKIISNLAVQERVMGRLGMLGVLGVVGVLFQGGGGL